MSGDNSWIYDKYSKDIERLYFLVDLLVKNNNPRYIKHVPSDLFEIANRIVDYKIRRVTINRIDSYFDVD